MVDIITKSGAKNQVQTEPLPNGGYAHSVAFVRDFGIVSGDMFTFNGNVSSTIACLNIRWGFVKGVL
jgi:hypothetical protein